MGNYHSINGSAPDTCPTWEAELEAYFGQFGELEDVYLPGKASSSLEA